MGESETPIGYRTGWVHEHFVNATFRTYFDTPVEDWEFSYTPDWPESVPQLFLWGSPFFAPELLTWLDSREDGSGHRRISQFPGQPIGDHWFMVRDLFGAPTVSATNAAMEEFIAGTFESDAPPATTGATAAPGTTTAATEATNGTTATATAATTAPPADDPDKSGSMSSRAVAVAGCVVPLVVSMFLA